MKKLPLVSIVITNYNRDKTIARSIESALEQDYPNIEIIVSDNCSTDNSNKIIGTYTSDNRIKYYHNSENLGMAGNFKVSFEQRAKGDYITIVNSDDELINPHFITQSVDLVSKYQNVVIVKSNHIVNHKGKDNLMNYESYKDFYTGINFLKEINFDLDFGWAGIFLHKKTLDDLNIFDSDITAADYITNFKLLLKGNICFNKNSSYKYNLHNNNASLNSYTLSKTKNLLHELNVFFDVLKKYTIPTQQKIIEQKIKFFYINSIYHLNYLNNRRNINQITNLLKNFDEVIFKTYQKQSKTRKFKLLFYFPKLGNLLTNLKKKIWG